MSGTGQKDSQAPTRLTPIVLDQSIVDTASGRPTPYFGQMIQRILSYLGQPGSTTATGTSTSSGLTVTEQLNNLTTSVETLQAASGGGTPAQVGLVARIASLEALVRNSLRYNQPPPAKPDFTSAQILSWWRQ